MKDTDILLERTGETIEYLKLYAQQQVDIIKLDTVEKSAKVLSSLITSFIIGIMMLIVLLLLTIAAALSLGQILSSPALGFLIISLFFIAFSGVLFIFKKTLITSPIISHFISEIYEEEDKD